MTNASDWGIIYSMIEIAKGADYMKKIYTIDEIRDIVKPVAEKYGIEEIWLFGSYARNEATEDSDVDLLVRYKQGLGLKFVGFVCDLEDALGLHVDVLTIDDLYLPAQSRTIKYLIKNIEKDRRLLVG